MYSVVQASVVGRQRHKAEKDNEDAKIVRKGKNIYILADGIGGQAGGGAASYLAAHFAYRELNELHELWCKGKLPLEFLPGLFQGSIQRCNEIISCVGKNSKSYRGMGTTLDACLVKNDTAYIGHIGNGRIYKFDSNGKIRKISEEHVPYIDEALTLEINRKTMVEMSLGLSRYLGMGENAHIDFMQETLDLGEGLLFATDGVTHTVSERELERAWADYEHLRTNVLRASNIPLDLAEEYARMRNITVKEAQKKLGGRDNTSFIAIRRIE